MRTLGLEKSSHDYNRVMFDTESKVQTKKLSPDSNPRPPALIMDSMALITTNLAVAKLPLDMKSEGGFLSAQTNIAL